MAWLLERDKRKGKAKLHEQDHLSLPLKTNVTTTYHDGECVYLKRNGELTRKLHRVRIKDISSILGDKDLRLKQIHDASRATIAIVYDPASRRHGQAYLELLGRDNQVKIAEKLIVKEIRKMYKVPLVPRVLMPIRICYHEISIPCSELHLLLGNDGKVLLHTEVLSGAWIEVDMGENPSLGKPWMRGVTIYGSDEQITNALSLISKLVPVEAVEREITTLKLFEVLNSNAEDEECDESGITSLRFKQI